ncbi:hypothetical protein JW935_10760 [candidate division KSB1 bacterium]|nr:hypothetical protein [candidate division KSB1 bacterium]
MTGDYAFVVNGRDGELWIIDISEPSAPVEAGFINPGGSLLAVDVSVSFACLGYHRSGLRVIDVSTPAAPTETSLLYTDGMVTQVLYQKNQVYVANSYNLKIINVTAPEAPVEKTIYDTGDWAADITLAGNYAYLALYGAGVQIADIPNPAEPEFAGNFETDNYAEGVAATGTNVV